MSLKKRSFSLSGHRTSVALEPEFWAVLEAEAAKTGDSFAAFIAAVDRAREGRPLASALRLRALSFAGHDNWSIMAKQRGTPP